jgi:hypothetical protein
MSRHVTDDVTDDLEKNLGKTVFACQAVVLLTKAGHDVTAKYPWEGGKVEGPSLKAKV